MCQQEEIISKFCVDENVDDDDDGIDINDGNGGGDDDSDDGDDEQTAVKIYHPMICYGCV